MWGGERPAPVCAWDASERAATVFFFFVCVVPPPHRGRQAPLHTRTLGECVRESPSTTGWGGVWGVRVSGARCVGVHRTRREMGGMMGEGEPITCTKKMKKKRGGQGLRNLLLFRAGGEGGWGRGGQGEGGVAYSGSGRRRGEGDRGREGKGVGVEEKKGEVNCFFFRARPGVCEKRVTRPGLAAPCFWLSLFVTPTHAKGGKEKGGKEIDKGRLTAAPRRPGGWVGRPRPRPPPPGTA